MKDKTYTLQLSTNEINFVTTPFTLITILNEDEVIIKLISEFHLKYNSITIPVSYSELLTKLLNKHGLIEFKKEFLSIIGFINYTVKLYTPEKIKLQRQKDLMLEFINEKNEWIDLLDFIKVFIYQKNKNDITQLNIKAKDTSLRLTNFFVIKDTIENICIGLNISTKNYDVRRTEILNELNNLNFNNLSKFIIRRMLSLMHDFLQSNDLSASDSLRFIGFIFRLSNINTEKGERVEIFPELETTLSDINIKNLRHFLLRKVSLEI